MVMCSRYDFWLIWLALELLSLCSVKPQLIVNNDSTGLVMAVWKIRWKIVTTVLCCLACHKLCAVICKHIQAVVIVIVCRVRGEIIWPALCCCALSFCTSYAHLYNEQFIHGRLDRALILLGLAVFRAPLCTWCYMWKIFWFHPFLYF